MAGDVNFKITAEDLASAVYKNFDTFQKKVIDDIIGASNGAAVATQKLAKETSTLTGFIRSQRAEQREQNFLYRQGRDAVGAVAFGLVALSGATNSADESSKKLNSSLQQGFLVFQGLNFILSGVNPAIGLTISLVGGLASALSVFTGSGSGAKEKLEDSAAAFKEIANAINSVDKDNVKAIQDFLGFLRGGSQREIQKETTNLVREQKSTVDGLALGLGGVKLLEITNLEVAKNKLGVLKETRKLTDEEFIKRSQIGLITSFADSPEKTKKDAEESKKRTDELLRYNFLLDEQIKSLYIIDGLTGKRVLVNDPEREQRQFEALTKFRNRGLFAQQGVGNVKNFAPDQSIINDTWINHLVDGFKQLGTTSENINSLVISSTQSAASAMTEAFFGATQSIGEFFTNMVKNIVQLIAEQLISKGILALLSSVIPGFGLATSLVGGASGGGGIFGPQTAVRGAGAEETFGARTIHINISGGTGNISIQEQKRAIRTIEKAIFNERA